MQLDVWLDSIDSHPFLTILPLTARNAAESVRLGDDFPNDPADQIIVATARCHNLTLITADERIRKWATFESFSTASLRASYTEIRSTKCIR
jgi:PIN domain nuclease of toxin-antitoxin system